MVNYIFFCPSFPARIYMIVVAGLCSCLSLHAQKDQVLDWKPEYSLNTYLVQQMHSQYADRRNGLTKALGSSATLRSYIAQAKKRYHALLGELPARTPLNPVVTGKTVADGYTIEKLAYESTPGHHVTANLYIPSARGPFPAVLLFCGHEDIAKATPSYQQTAILFAQQGYVVLVIDPVSQSERYQLTDVSGKPLTRGGTTEHTLLNASSNLLGLSTPADELWDNVRGLDYLVTRNEVDTARIGCLGNSGGGMQTIYFAGFDERIKVIAPCSYLATRERTMELTGPADGCAQIPGEGEARLEFADYLMMAAPKPLLVLAGRYDFIDYTGTEEAYAELKKVYTVLGHPEKAGLFVYDDGHGISQPKREAVVQWFNRWLKNETVAVMKKTVSIRTPAELAVATTGQTATFFNGEQNLVDRNLQRFEALKSTRTMLKSQPGKWAAAIRQLVRINDTDRSVSLEEKGMARYRGTDFHRVIVRKKNEVPIPVLISYPQTAAGGVWIGCYDKPKHQMAAGDSIQELLAQGYVVILADLRGIGETEDRAEFNDPKYYNREYRNAMLALHTGRSLAGMRATDVLSLLDMVQQDKQLRALPVTVAASGINVLPALLAAAADTGIALLSLSGGIGTYREIWAKPAGRDWYSYVVPGIAAIADIPDMIQIIGEQKIRWNH